MIDNEKIILSSDVKITPELIKKIIEKHEPIVNNRFKILNDYYNGKHEILKRNLEENKPNHKPVSNFCKYITDILTGFFMGKPVDYASTNEIMLEDIKNIMKINDESSKNHTLANKASIKGQAFELVYIDENSNICFDSLDTDSVICCYDNTIKNNITLAIRYYKDVDILTEKEKIIIDVYTKDKVYHYTDEENKMSLIAEENHYFGEVPIIEYANNRYRKSDFEPIISLNDMYNLNTADISNDIAYFSNAYMVFEGMRDDTEEKDIKMIEKRRTIMLPESGKAYFLEKKINDQAIQNHRSNLKEDIHKLSYVPDLTDIGNVSNLSGSAIKQKFFSTEQLISNKEREFKKALQKRLRLIVNILIKKEKKYNANDIDIIFNRNIPVNSAELGDVVSKYAGVLPFEILLEQLNKSGAEIDIKRAIGLKEEEQERKIDLNTIPDNEDDLDE